MALLGVGLVAEYIFEDLARIPVEVEYASEFRYRNPANFQQRCCHRYFPIRRNCRYPSDIKLAKEEAFVFGICNVVGSSILEKPAGAYTQVRKLALLPPNIHYTNYLLTLIALRLAKAKGSVSNSDYKRYLVELETIPTKVEEVLKSDKLSKQIAEIYKDVLTFVLGRGFNFPVALEGALKLKEISYIHAKVHPAAEIGCMEPIA